MSDSLTRGTSYVEFQGFQLCIEEEASTTVSSPVASAAPLKSSDKRHSIKSSTDGQACRAAPHGTNTLKRSIHSHSLAFRLRHQGAKQAGAKTTTEPSMTLQDRSFATPVTPQSRISALQFTGGLTPSVSKMVPSVSFLLKCSFLLRSLISLVISGAKRFQNLVLEYILYSIV